jgi:hypothetical protein
MTDEHDELRMGYERSDMTGPERDEFRRVADEMAQEAGPIIGYQRARMGANRMTAFIEGHGELQAMALFLVMSALTASRLSFNDEALAVLRKDADDVRQAADKWATSCEQLADHWQAQRQEGES